MFAEKAGFISLVSKFAFVCLAPMTGMLLARKGLSAEVGNETNLIFGEYPFLNE
jgi:hypothetical protein